MSAIRIPVDMLSRFIICDFTASPSLYTQTCLLSGMAGMEISVRQSQCANACSQIRSNLEFGLNEIRLRLVQE